MEAAAGGRGSAPSGRNGRFDFAFSLRDTREVFPHHSCHHSAVIRTGHSYSHLRSGVKSGQQDLESNLRVAGLCSRVRLRIPLCCLQLRGAPSPQVPHRLVPFAYNFWHTPHFALRSRTPPRAPARSPFLLPLLCEVITRARDGLGGRGILARASRSRRGSDLGHVHSLFPTCAPLLLVCRSASHIGEAKSFPYVVQHWV